MAGMNVITVFGFFVLKQDEIGVRLTLGKFTDVVLPGLGFCIPLLQKIVKTKRSLQTVDLPEQQIVLSGNISVTISGNLNFRVEAPERALLEVGNYHYSIKQLALTTIADVLGTKTIEEVRRAKAQIAQEIETIISKTAAEWGLNDVDIRLTDARLDENLQRAMMRETEAQKEANAIKIKAESDKYVSKIFAEAAHTLGKSPGAMTLRLLQTLSDVSNDKTTVVIPVPIELLNIAQQTNLSSNGLPDSEETATETTMLGKVEIKGDKFYALCPTCSARYHVTEILGKPNYDKRPDLPGQQVQCKRCESFFTLPEILNSENES